jgi:hypothetical protein
VAVLKPNGYRWLFSLQRALFPASISGTKLRYAIRFSDARRDCSNFGTLEDSERRFQTEIVVTDCGLFALVRILRSLRLLGLPSENSLRKKLPEVKRRECRTQ